MDKRQAVQEALNAYAANPKPAETAPTPTPAEPAAAAPKREGGEPLIPKLGSIDDYGSELAEYIVWFCSDGILHSDDEIFEAVFRKLPFNRRGAKIVSRINNEIDELRTTGRIK